MSIQEVCSKQKVILAMNSDIVSATTTYSTIIDTADYDLGVYFASAILGNDSTSFSAVFTIQEGDESNMSDASDVINDKLVYKGAVALSALTSVAAGVIKEAVFATKRYLRIKVVTTGHGVDIQAVIFAIANPELSPVSQT